MPSTRTPQADPHSSKLVLLEGDDRAQREAHVKAIVDAQGLEDLAVERIRAEALEISQIAARLATPSFFAERRLFVVMADELPAAGLDQLVEVLKSGLPEEVSVALCVSSLDKRRASSKWLSGNAQVLACRARAGDALRSWLQAKVGESGVGWAPGALSALLQQVGEHEALLASELDKLALYVGPGGRVTAEIVAQVASHPQHEPAQYAIFRLVDGLGERRAAAALAELSSLLAAGQHPLGILAMIARQFRLIYATKAQRGGLARIAGELEVKEFQLKKASGQGRLFSWAELDHAWEQFAECDRRLKLSADGEMCLQTLIVQLCAASDT